MVVVALLLYVLWRAPEPDRDDLSTYGAFALPVVLLAAAPVA